MTPLISIVIPTFNREKLISRAIDSCLRQSFSNFELIVVDDFSTDNSRAVVREYADSRIRLICHLKNRGVGPARNTGVDNAHGEWVVFLDSDDELLPGALDTISRSMVNIPSNVSRMQFMVRWDTGEVSPDPPFKNEFFDYYKYAQWMESVYNRPSETLPVMKRSTFEKVKFADDKSLEGNYHLSFMKEFNAWCFPEIIRLYHHDAENQLTKPQEHTLLQDPNIHALSVEKILREHGDVLKKLAPKIYQNQISALALFYFLCGKKALGVRYSLKSICYSKFSIKVIFHLLFGIIGPKSLARAKVIIRRLLI